MNAKSRRRTAGVVGLTGGIGSGKSTVAAMLGALGAFVVDCDGLGRQVIEPHGRAYARVVERFGPGIVREDGQIDRGALAAIVFRDEDQLAALNAISHPAIDAEIAERIADAPTDQLVVLDMAVLVETDLGAGQYDTVVVVETPLEVRLARLAQRGMTEDDARARIASQATDDQRRAVADYVIDNGGDIDDLRDEVATLWDALTR
ncbi:MAG TPA: dephospho-CoA kinase [Acidimicrobiales bacterium]|nr:dephospho-CoA kinase [Acidimicrobiales bacterium]